MRRCGPGFGFKIFFGALFCGLFMALAVMLLWNWLIPEIFHGPQVNFFQALGLLLLVKILVGFKGGWGGGPCNHHDHQGGMKGYWRQRWEEKLNRMSPEERAKAREKYRNWCGWGGAEEESKGNKDESTT